MDNPIFIQTSDFAKVISKLDTVINNWYCNYYITYKYITYTSFLIKLLYSGIFGYFHENDNGNDIICKSIIINFLLIISQAIILIITYYNAYQIIID